MAFRRSPNTPPVRAATGDAFWADVVDSWLDTNEPPSTPAWHPYPTSLRIVAWSAALSSIHGWPAYLREKVAASILRQARYLRRVVEHDVGGNHVIKNATALAVAGGLFPSSGLLEPALRRLERETAAQVLADGGHEERTTSYHRLVMADLTDVRDLLTRIDHPVAAWLDDVLARMTAWASIMAGPDGRLPLLNDSWEGPAISHGGPELSVLRESGYVVLRHGEDQLVFDCGPLCPRHLPAHAHADALSVVVWLDGVPVIIDRGSGSYTGTIRECSRSTRAHNTVEIGGEDQCVFFGDFRAARLPRVAEAGVEHHGEVTVVCSAHDGYRRLPVPAQHTRSVVWWPHHGVVLLDRILAAEPVSVRSALTLAPGAPRPEPVGSLTTELHRQSVLWPVFGREVQTDVVEIHGNVCGDVVFGGVFLTATAPRFFAVIENGSCCRAGTFRSRFRSPGGRARFAPSPSQAASPVEQGPDQGGVEQLQARRIGDLGRARPPAAPSARKGSDHVTERLPSKSALLDEHHRHVCAATPEDLALTQFQRRKRRRTLMVDEGFWDVSDRLTPPDKGEERIVLFAGKACPGAEPLGEAPAFVEQRPAEDHVRPYAGTAEVRALEPIVGCPADSKWRLADVLASDGGVSLCHGRRRRPREHTPGGGRDRLVLERGHMVPQPLSIRQCVVVGERHERCR